MCSSCPGPATKMPKFRDSSSASAGGFIRHIISDADVDSSIRNLGDAKLVILYFYLPWCGSCQKLTPAVDSLASKYTAAIFLQANAEKCPLTTKRHHVFRVPSFLFFHNQNKVDRIEGPTPGELEAKIRRNLMDLQNMKTVAPPSHPFLGLSQRPKMFDVKEYMIKEKCHCINDLTPTSFHAFIDGKKLVSGKGTGRLLLVYAFKEKMILTAVKVRAPVYSAPKSLRFFVNLSKVLDFSVASQMSSTMEVQLTDDVLTGDHAIVLKNGGLAGVENLQIYIPENMTKNKKTEIESLTLIGGPMSATTILTETETPLAITFPSDGFAVTAYESDSRLVSKESEKLNSRKRTIETSSNVREKAGSSKRTPKS